MLGQFFGALARAKESGHRHWRDVLADEKLAFFPIVPPHRMRGPIAELFIHALTPHVWGLNEVRICGNDTIGHALTLLTDAKLCVYEVEE